MPTTAVTLAAVFPADTLEVILAVEADTASDLRPIDNFHFGYHRCYYTHLW
jgi:hypothetical protein